MKVGDLVFVDGHEIGLVVSEARLSEDCKPGGEAYPYERYYLVDVVSPHGDLESYEEEELEIISESR